MPPFVYRIILDYPKGLVFELNKSSYTRSMYREGQSNGKLLRFDYGTRKIKFYKYL